MAEATSSASQDLFNCPVCLEPQNDPVSIPCGHIHCMTCITSFWDQTGDYSCPQCRQTFVSRPALQRNTLVAEQSDADPSCVVCDICTWRKLRAVKFCLTCLAFYCEEHIQFHQESEALRRHVLVEPNGHIHQKMCTRHQKVLQLFCRTDQTAVCYLCLTGDHQGHDANTTEEERAVKQIELGVTQSKLLKRIQEKQEELHQIRHNIDLLKSSAERETQESRKIFTSLVCIIEDAQKKVIELIRQQETREMEKAERAMSQLEKEIEELKKKNAELTELSKTVDHIHFLQVFPTLYIPPEKHLLNNSAVNMDFPSKDLRKELSRLKEHLEEISKLGFVRRIDRVRAPPAPNIREDFLPYSCQLTLDGKTANKVLAVSEEKSMVTWRKYPPRRSHGRKKPSIVKHQIMCGERLAGTRCYWEVEWSGEVDIGVVYKGVATKAKPHFGDDDRSWCLNCSSRLYSCFSARHNNVETIITADRCPKIGVYLDYAAGYLSFYSVSNTMSLLHQFKATFPKPLCPVFALLYGSAVNICQLK
ncbi:tripartite motif-containing protein 16-like [Erpetoichthys calabaricus]|uniref:tripartite motif-containing protein 16-like n=1 Tax=Erpetoichthys calabaricus TaxID=27687 RepID=UPI0022340BD7|nr:tripartite motif-containing protein 16-like [Erpetoichthys calabaricus]